MLSALSHFLSTSLKKKLFDLFFFLITFSISMYIMCICLFSALSHRVDALQISMIIIKRTLICKTPTILTLLLSVFESR